MERKEILVADKITKIYGIGTKTLYKYREICKIIYKKGTERKSEMKLKKWSSEGGFKGKS